MQFIVHEEGRIAVSGEKLLVKDGCENTGNKTAVSATLATYSANGENYVRVTASGTVVKTGVFPIGGTFTVAPGERYRIRAKGYRTGANAVYLMIKANTTELGFPGSALPSSAATEAWIEQIVTIPAGTTTLQAGVTWNTVTASQQFYLNEFEIEQLTSITPEYQYHLKDHLGNVRVTFTTKDETLNYTATFENNTQTTEQATFRNYTRVTNDLYDHTDAGTTYDKVQLLNGGNNSQVGITKSIAVMPGDVVSASVWAKYFGATGGSGNLTGFASALLSAFGLTAPAGGEAGTASAAIQSYGSFIAGGGNTGNSSWPKGWLNMLIFDKNYNLVDLAYQQLDATYVQPVGNSTKMPMQQLSLSKTIKEPGYVYIYISNEGSVQQDIYFDDMNITHTKSKIIQADDYYPFGLTFNSYQRENSVINDFLYSGKEQQDELGLNWSDFGARMYMADLGRWGVVDPLTEKAMDWTPYRYAFNNPLLYIDPTGMSETYVKGGYGETINTSDVAAHSGAVYNANGEEVQSYSFVSNKTGKTIATGNFTSKQINDWSDGQKKQEDDVQKTHLRLEGIRLAKQSKNYSFSQVGWAPLDYEEGRYSAQVMALYALDVNVSVYREPIYDEEFRVIGYQPKVTISAVSFVSASAAAVIPRAKVSIGMPGIGDSFNYYDTKMLKVKSPTIIRGGGQYTYVGEATFDLLRHSTYEVRIKIEANWIVEYDNSNRFIPINAPYIGYPIGINEVIPIKR